jgi:hypothetical protein
MSTAEQPFVAPSRAPRAHWAGWIGKAVFEASLIVLGLVGALLIDEWRDERERRARLETAMASIRAELEENRKAVATRLARNERLIADLRVLATAGRTYEGGLIRPGLPISDVVWEASQDAGITADIPLDQLITLGRVYGALADYRSEMAAFSEQLYADPAIATAYRTNPLNLVGRYNDITGRVRRLHRLLRAALDTLPPPRS